MLQLNTPHYLLANPNLSQDPLDLICSESPTWGPISGFRFRFPVHPPALLSLSLF